MSSNIDYNTTYIPDNFIINEKNVGIGTTNPTNTLTIIGNHNIYGNLNIYGNINLPQYTLNDGSGNSVPNFLVYNTSNNALIPHKLLNNSILNWTQQQNQFIDSNFKSNRDSINTIYQSQLFNISSNDDSITIFTKYTTIITHIYINNNSINNVYLNNTISITKELDNYYKLSTHITTNKDNITTINFKNLGSYNIILFGFYNFTNKGILWKNNPYYNNISIYSNKNVGIKTTNPTHELDICGNTTISQDASIKYLINTNSAIIDNLNTNIINTNNIYTKELNIKTNHIGINSTNPKNFLQISDNFYIAHNNTTYIDNSLYISNDIATSKNILFDNEPIISISKTNNKYYTNINTLQFTRTDINTSLLSDTTTQIFNNLNIKSQTHKPYKLNVEGNINISGKIHIVNNIICSTIQNITYNHTTVNEFTNLNTLNVSNSLISNNTNTINANIYNLNIPSYSETELNNYDHVKTIIYDKTNNVFKGKNNTTINSFVSTNNTDYVNVDSHSLLNITGHSDLLYTNSKRTYTNNIETLNKITIPYKELYPSTYNQNHKPGTLRFNNQLLKAQIFNGTEWSNIKYTNDNYKIKYITFHTPYSILIPQFNENIFDYTIILTNKTIDPFPNSIHIDNFNKLYLTPNTYTEFQIILFNNSVEHKIENSRNNYDYSVITYPFDDKTLYNLMNNINTPNYNKIKIISSTINSYNVLEYTINIIIDI